MIAGAVIVPGAPVLLPGVTGRPVPEVEQLRAACLEALSGWPPDGPVVVVAADPTRGGAHPDDRERCYPPHAPSALARFAPGRDRVAGAAPPTGLEVARTLLEQAGVPREAVELVALPPTWTAAETDRLGRILADRAGLLVVVADGTPCRRPAGSPVAFDPRATAFDDRLRAAIAAGDAAALRRLDPVLAAELRVRGLSGLHVLAAALPAPGSARVTYADDPLGVYYVVGTWTA